MDALLGLNRILHTCALCSDATPGGFQQPTVCATIKHSKFSTQSGINDVRHKMAPLFAAIFDEDIRIMVVFPP